MSDTLQENFHQHVRDLQDQITREIRLLDPKVTLKEDVWDRVDHAGHPGGGGRTRAFQEGSIFENAGVNTSCVFGKIDPAFASKLQGEGDTMDDFRHFHGVWQKAAGDHYSAMKKECDEYFVNFHRGHEMRGIGGIFFDGHNTGDLQKDFAMVKSLSENFIQSYFPLVEKRFDESYTAEDEEFQLHRRGRYVEFNLLHDRGTLFGLKTNGRVDSILISLPARCKFTYQYAPKAGSPHEKMMAYYRPQNWV